MGALNICLYYGKVISIPVTQFNCVNTCHELIKTPEHSKQKSRDPNDKIKNIQKSYFLT